MQDRDFEWRQYVQARRAVKSASGPLGGLAVQRNLSPRAGDSLDRGAWSPLALSLQFGTEQLFHGSGRIPPTALRAPLSPDDTFVADLGISGLAGWPGYYGLNGAISRQQQVLAQASVAALPSASTRQKKAVVLTGCGDDVLELKLQALSSKRKFESMVRMRADVRMA